MAYLTIRFTFGFVKSIHTICYMFLLFCFTAD